jgi:hypothetical protein
MSDEELTREQLLVEMAKRDHDNMKNAAYLSRLAMDRLDEIRECKAEIAQLQPELDVLEILINKVRGLIRTSGIDHTLNEIVVAKNWWNSMTMALEEYDVIKDRK